MTNLDNLVIFLEIICIHPQLLIIEREIRHKMKEKAVQSLQVYPENRDTAHPTTSKIFDIFESIYTYEVIHGDDVVERYRDELNDTQESILKLLSISQEAYWQNMVKC